MGLLEMVLISFGVSMDAFAVSICKGLSLEKISLKNTLIVGLFFGSFQAIMPFIGYTCGIQFKKQIASIDHWIALILLGYIGISMIISSLKDQKHPCDCSLDYKNMLGLSIATSIDALAVGISLSFIEVDIIKGITLIGIITFILSAIGVRIGSIFGTKFKSKAEFIGGIILVYLGIRIFLQHII
ncbi:MAG TPA: manganese efflux pump [Eubacteriaceae bacterium]|nr:manganese efflux pump [Eubacteriaceae bacterium]